MSGMYGYGGPAERLLEDASRMVPRERWQTCPKCDAQCPVMFGDPDGEHWCAFCEIDKFLGVEA